MPRQPGEMTSWFKTHTVSNAHKRAAVPNTMRPIPGLAAPAAAIPVVLDDENPFLSEQDDVFIAEHASGAASANGCR